MVCGHFTYRSKRQFFFTNVLKRNWHTFSYLNAKRERRLPCILSRPEVYRILGKVKNRGAVSKTPMAIDSVQGAFRQARFAAGIKKRRVSIHTLRHYAELGIRVTATPSICSKRAPIPE